jgi:hypothetical protein
MHSLLKSISGIPVKEIPVNTMLEIKIQVKFPKSKRKRIRKKFKNNPKNWGILNPHRVCLFDNSNRVLLCTNIGFEKLKNGNFNYIKKVISFKNVIDVDDYLKIPIYKPNCESIFNDWTFTPFIKSREPILTTNIC